MTIWADYSAGRPSGAALRAAGFSGVIRYVGTPGRTKNITAGEYQDLVGHNLSVLLVHENGTGDVLRGHAGGVADAHAALANARACSIPDSVGIAAASDRHLTAAQVRVGVQHQAGFTSVLGVARTGAYGFSEYVSAVRAAGTARPRARACTCGSATPASARPRSTESPATSMTPDEAQVAALNALRAFFNGDLYPRTVPDTTYQAPLSRFIQNTDMFGYQVQGLVDAVTDAVKGLTDKTDQLAASHAALTAKVDALAGLVTATANRPSEPVKIKDDIPHAIENATKKLGGIGSAAEHAIEHALEHKS